MKEKNILVYKLFLSLNISDFSLIFMKKLNSLKRSPLSFSVIPPLPPPPSPSPGRKRAGDGCILRYRQIDHPKFTLLTEMQL